MPTLVFVEALDGGDPETQVEYRDEVFQLEAPFNGTPVSLLKTINRYSYIQWGDDQTAIAIDRWWNTRNTKTYVFNPSDASRNWFFFFDRNYQDRYSDPGRFVTERNEMGSCIEYLNESKAYLIGSGYSKEGQFPFLDQLDLNTSKTNASTSRTTPTDWKASVSMMPLKKNYWSASNRHQIIPTTISGS